MDYDFTNPDRLDNDMITYAAACREAMAAAATMQLSHVVLHVDWNQASIDSNRVSLQPAEP